MKKNKLHNNYLIDQFLFDDWDYYDDYLVEEDYYNVASNYCYEYLNIDCSQRYVVKGIGVIYYASKSKPIDMESIYDKQSLRQRRIDQVLGISLDVKLPVFGDIFPNNG